MHTKTDTTYNDDLMNNEKRIPKYFTNDINDSLILENSFPNNFDLTSDNSNNNDDYMNINFSNDGNDNDINIDLADSYLNDNYNNTNVDIVNDNSNDEGS
ncbi:6564_t:CDS:2, partial [Funneliformis caledonium]